MADTVLPVVRTWPGSSQWGLDASTWKKRHWLQVQPGSLGPLSDFALTHKAISRAAPRGGNILTISTEPGHSMESRYSLDKQGCSGFSGRAPESLGMTVCMGELCRIWVGGVVPIHLEDGPYQCEECCEDPSSRTLGSMSSLLPHRMS